MHIIITPGTGLHMCQNKCIKGSLTAGCGGIRGIGILEGEKKGIQRISIAVKDCFPVM